MCGMDRIALRFQAGGPASRLVFRECCRVPASSTPSINLTCRPPLLFPPDRRLRFFLSLQGGALFVGTQAHSSNLPWAAPFVSAPICHRNLSATTTHTRRWAFGASSTACPNLWEAGSIGADGTRREALSMIRARWRFAAVLILA